MSDRRARCCEPLGSRHSGRAAQSIRPETNRKEPNYCLFARHPSAISGNQTPEPDSILGDPSKPDKLCNRAVLRSIAGALDVQPLDSAARNLCGLQVHASAVSAGSSRCSILPNRDHRLDRSLTGGPRISVGATSGHQVAPANMAGARGARNIHGTLDCVSANWRNAFEPAHSSHPGSWRRGLARLGVLRRAYGDNPL